MRTKIFLASSSELEEDRKDFEIFISRKNKDWADQGAFLDLIVWENFLDALSATRLQDEYNKAIRECDVFVMLFCTKVGKYTEEEFKTAFGQFKATNKPLIYTYFKDAEITTGSANKDDLKTLWAFQEKVKALGHFYTVYKNVDALKFLFNQQLDKLAEKGFIELIDESQKGTPSVREKPSLERQARFVSAVVEWKRMVPPDPNPRRWVVYVDNNSDAPITVQDVLLRSALTESPIEIEGWGPVKPSKTLDYELDEADFDPMGDPPEVTVRFRDSFGQNWVLKNNSLRAAGRAKKQ